MGTRERETPPAAPEKIVGHRSLHITGAQPAAAAASPGLKKQDKKTYTADEAKKLEDKVVKIVDGLNEEEQATAYWYLRKNGMTEEKARDIRLKTKLTGV